MFFTLKRCLIPFALICCINVSEAQDTACDNKITLQLVEKKTAAPLISSVVSLEGRETQTDENGICSFDSVCIGKHAITIVTIDNDSFQDVVDFKGEKKTIVVAVAKTDVTLDDVEIQGHKLPLKTANAATTLSGSDLQKVQGNSLAAQLQSVPGVRMLQTGGTIAKPIINGMYGNRVLILNNGVRQQGQQWGAEHAPEIDPYAAQQITVVKGAESVLYGSDAIGGVVLVDPAALPTDNMLHGDVSLLGASNGHQGAASASISSSLSSVPGLAFRLQGSALQNGNLKTSDYFLNNTGMKAYNYAATLGYTKKHFDANVYYSHFSTSLGILKDFGNDATFTYDINAPKQKVIHDLLKVAMHYHLNDYWHLSAQYAYQYDNRQEYDVRRGGISDIPVLNLDLHTQSLDVSADYFNGNEWKITLGTSGMYQDNKSKPGSMIAPLIPDYILKTTGVFGIAQFLKPNYTVEAGLRYDYLHLYALGYDAQSNLYGGKKEYNSINGNIGAIWYLPKNISIRSNISTAWRPPSVNELYSNGVHHGALSYEVGDSNMRTEKSYKWITSISYNYPHWLKVNWDLYAQYFNGYIYLNPMDSLVENIRGSFPYFLYHQTNARFLGTDVTVSINFLKQFEYTATASIIRARNTNDNSYLPSIPSDKFTQQLQWNIPVRGHVSNTFVNISHQFVDKQHNYLTGSDYAPPPPSYHLFGLGLGTQITVGKHQLKTFLTIENLTNQTYRDYMNRYRYYVDDMGRNIQLRLIYSI